MKRIIGLLMCVATFAAVAAPATAAMRSTIFSGLSRTSAANGGQVAFDARGNATAVFVTESADNAGKFNGSELWTANKPYGSTEFDTPRRARPLAAPDATTRISSPVIAVTPAGDTTVAWSEGPGGINGHADLWTARRPAGSTEFEAPTRISDGTETATQFELASGTDGSTTLVWRSGRDYTEAAGYVATIRASVRAADGSTFRSPVGLSSSGRIDRFDFSAARDGGVAVGWLSYPSTGAQQGAPAGEVTAHVARKAPGAVDFSPEVRLDAPTDRGLTDPIQVAQAPGNETTAIWSTARLSVVNPSGTTRFNLSKTIRPDGSITECPVFSFADSDLDTSEYYGAFFSGAASDAEGNVTATWFRFRSLATVIKRPGQACFEPELTVGPDFESSSLTELVPDGRGGMFLLRDVNMNRIGAGSMGYRPAIGTATGAAFPTFTSIVGVAGWLATDSFGNAIATWSDNTGTLLAEIVDRAPPTMSEVVQPAHPEIAKPTTLSVSATDAYSPPVTVRWTFSDGDVADGPSVTKTFAAGTSPKARVTATDALGNLATQSVDIRQEPPPPPPAPTLTIALSRGQFGVARGARTPLDKAAVKGSAGARLQLKASAAGTARFTLTRTIRGHRVGAKCRPGAPSRRHPKACKTQATLSGAPTLAVNAGTSDVRLTGRWGTKRLSPGQFELTATLDASGRASAPAKVGFRISG